MLKAHSSVTVLLRKVSCMQQFLAMRWRSKFSPAPSLIARPARALNDEQISIQGRFLPPHWPVTVRAHIVSEEGDLWEAFSHYNTDGNGVVDLTMDHSVGGSYVGCEPMGLFWAMQPAPSAREGVRLRKKDVETPFVTQLSLLAGHVSHKRPIEDSPLAVSTVERWFMAPHTRRVQIRQNGIVGTLFLPSGPGPFPAVVDLWGMGGGLHEYRAALFASKGIASFALAYFGHKDIPGPVDHVNVGDDYFRSAYNLLQDRPEVCGDRVGLIGLSHGGYLVLRMATEIGVKPKCGIVINGPVGSHGQKPGKSLNIVDEHGHFDLRHQTLPASFPEDKKVKLELLECPLLYIVGEDDKSCWSIESANEIEEVLGAIGKAHLFTRLSYPGAGHLMEPPYSPHSRHSFWSVKPTKVMATWGGQLVPHAAAQEDSWKKMFDFLDYNLRR